MPLQTQTSDAYETALLEIVKSSASSLSARDIAFRLRARHIPVPDYKVTKYLRGMLRAGQIHYQKGKWTQGLKENAETSQIIAPKSIIPPIPSPELESILKGIRFDRRIDESKKETEQAYSENAEQVSVLEKGKWGKFRRLVSYYRKCIKNEEGAEAFAFLNQHLEKYIYLNKSGHWQPRYGLRWRSNITLGPHLSEFIKNLDKASSEQAVVLGYPLQGKYIHKEGEPETSFVQPVFYLPVEYSIAKGNLVFTIDDPRPEINLKWLQFAFNNNPKRQHSFLSACGFINRSHPNDEIYGTEKAERIPSLENIVATLKVFMPEQIREPLHINSITDTSISSPFKSGIFNRAVLMIANKTRYTETLLKELAFIEKASVQNLNRTALKHIFADNTNEQSSTKEFYIHEGIIAETMQMNAEQRRAAASLLNSNVTVVTGPPGTGKSQVVSSAIANARLKNITVLFASRNHKAIDAVYDRLIDQKHRPLIVRTNSKDDPSFRFNFRLAIKEMLAIPCDISKIEQSGYIKEEISELLSSRGNKAQEVSLIEKAGLEIGELENQLIHISQLMPKEQVEYLNRFPEHYPLKSLDVIIKSLQRIQVSGYDKSLSAKIGLLLESLYLFPLICKARSKLRNIPETVSIPYFLGSLEPKELSNRLAQLKRSTEFIALRKRCVPLENELRQLPPLEELSSEIGYFSSRLVEIIQKAISLDLDSREGLSDNCDREELTGLKAAIGAIKTGLEVGNIEADTERILHERVPMVLNSFPCWAVTNLSVGSLIPLVAGMYDLSLIDEASQSDIPSAIPILFRAKRVGVIGDPFQLTHTSKLSTAKDTILRREVGLSKTHDMRFAYTENSLYGLVSSSNKAEPIFLSETYRSESSIAEYSNQTFYSGRLRVATDPKKLKVPHGMRPGLHWTNTKGEIKSGGGSGCFCQEEIDEVVKLVQTILCKTPDDKKSYHKDPDTGEVQPIRQEGVEFKGTIGIVTPFRQQANRLQDALYQSNVPFDALTRAEAHIDTAHGFQGDERDVIIFSLCAGPNMPAGSLSFLRETGNLFNVAVSRARALVHVVGNKAWSQACGIRHIQSLTIEKATRMHDPKLSPWHPHESPWEEILHNALVERGLKPLPQFPVLSRRLDLALMRNSDNPLKIDIEVDGDCHRNADGSRKIDDVWRDIQLQGMGWKVMRFWVYQLREDLDKCVEKINDYWSKHE
jgi:very-short-patch-repair endonuclease